MGGLPLNEKLKKELIWITAVLVILIGSAAANLVYISEHNKSIAQNVNQNPTYPSNAEIIHVTGRQWSWQFTYSNGTSSTNTFLAHVGQPVVLIVTSVDVIHDLIIPQMDIQSYAVPGQNNSLEFTPTKTGSFYFECAEYCGLNHYEMRGNLTVVS